MVRLHVPRQTVFDLQVMMFGVVCMMVGAILCFFILTVNQASKMVQLMEQQERQVEKLTDTIEYFRTWKGLVDARFTEQDGAILRIEHAMGIPMHERRDAVEAYDLFGEGQ